MTLTKRRYEFLETLAVLVQENGGPVHYGDVAERLEVSKWTAYAMMRELASDGYVETSYLANRQGEPGRSVVLFEPTRKGVDLVRSQAVKENSFSEGDLDIIASDLMSGVTEESMQKTSSSLISYCAALITILLIEVTKTGFDVGMLKDVLETSSQNSTSVSLFVGLLLGILLVQGARKIRPDLEKVVEILCTQIETLEESDEDKILEFAQAIVSGEVST